MAAGSTPFLYKQIAFMDAVPHAGEVWTVTRKKTLLSACFSQLCFHYNENNEIRKQKRPTAVCTVHSQSADIINRLSL